MIQKRKVLPVLFFIFFLVVFSLVSAEIDLEASVEWAQKNLVGAELPKEAGYLVGNERAVLYVEDKEWVLNGITKDNNVESIGKGELENPTLKVYTTSTTLIEILNSEHQMNSFIQAEKAGKIRIDPVGVKRTVKFSIASLLSRFLKSDEPVQQLQDQKTQRKLRQANPNPNLLREESVKRRLSSDNPRPLPEPRPQELEPAFIVEGNEGGNDNNAETNEEGESEEELIACETMADCPGEKPFCLRNVCRTIDEFISSANSCDDNGDCGENEVCDSNECVVDEEDVEPEEELITCETMADCPGEKPFCLGGYCRTIAEFIERANSCERNEDCTGGRVCEENRCVLPDRPVQNAQLCEDNSDCREGMVCTEGRCAIPISDEDNEVGEEETEEEFQGIPSCDSDPDCGQGKICIAGLCIPGYRQQCQISEDCQEGRVCREQRCVQLQPVPSPEDQSVGERLRTIIRRVFRDVPEPISYGDDVNQQYVDGCEEDDLYNNGECDEDCLNPDPDCDREVCDNNEDDDGDSRVDCRDPNCDLVRRESDRKICQYRGETRCTDDFDNDADGSVDCDDHECNDDPFCVEEVEPEFSTLGWGEFDHCKRRLLIINDLQTCSGSGYLLSNKVIAVRAGPLGADLTPLTYEVLEQDGEDGRSARLCSSLETIDPAVSLRTDDPRELYDSRGCPAEGTYEGVDAGYRYFDIPIDDDSTTPITYDLQINFGRTEDCVAGGDKKKFENNVNCCGTGSLKSFRVPIENHGVNKVFFLKLSSVVPACDYYGSSQCDVPGLTTCVS